MPGAARAPPARSATSSNSLLSNDVVASKNAAKSSDAVTHVVYVTNIELQAKTEESGKIFAAKLYN
jgi:hypothetical protein